MSANEIVARFLKEQCEVSASFEISEAALFVIFSGWCKMQGEEMPASEHLMRELERIGVVRRAGKLTGLKLEGFDESGIRELLGPTLYEYVQALKWDELRMEADVDRPGDLEIEFERTGDSVIAFVNACCEFGNSCVPISQRELYEAYVVYCSARARKPVKEDRFLKTLQSPKLCSKGANARSIALKREFAENLLLIRVDPKGER